MVRTRRPLRPNRRTSHRISSTSWLDLREGENVEAAGTLLHAGVHGLTIGLPDGSKLSILANDARILRPLMANSIVIDVFRFEHRLHASSAEISNCYRSHIGSNREGAGGLAGAAE
jgi:hypothetical protein